MHRFVIKIGTNLLTREDGMLNTDFIEKIATQVKRLLTNKQEILIVTSGAVAAGRGEMHLVRRDAETLHEKQALAAIGQGTLMQRYYKIFTIKHKTIIAQVLLQAHDFENLDTLQNTHNTLKLLISKEVVPIINENDVTATDELRYMANDRLAARVANLVGADGLILLTDVEGLYDDEPHENPKAKLIKTTNKDELKQFADCVDNKCGRGHGGMKTKLEAAQIAECPVWIANGNNKNVLTDIILKNENPGTVIN